MCDKPDVADARATHIRDHAARSWPATERALAPGWLLRSTPTVARGRLNSALTLEVDPDLAAVEAFYASRGQPAQVQLTPLEAHPRLATELDARGWTTKWPSQVLAADAARVASPGADAADVDVLSAPTDDWLAAWAASEERDPSDVEAHARAVLSQLDGRAAYALEPDGQAVGLGVVEGEWCGLFAIATVRARRRGGLGTAIVRTLAAHARERGATGLYLEVEERNAPALGLYGRLGFELCYRYVHRMAPSD